MCTYEDLVDATLPHGLIPLVVPQLRTITLGGAVTGLGIESTSFRNGLPHESVLEMDVFTGAGESSPPTAGTSRRPVRRASPTPTAPSATRRGCGSSSSRCARACAAARALRRPGRRSPRAGERDRRRGRVGRGAVDAVDGVVFARRGPTSPSPRWTDEPRATRLHRRADLLPVDPAARRETDADDARLPVAVGHRLVLVLARVRRAGPRVRRLWPRRWRRSDVYHRLVGLERRYRDQAPVDRRAGLPARAGDPGRRGPGRAAGGVPRWFDERGRHAPGLAVPAAAASTARAPWRCTRSTPARPTSTSASGARRGAARAARATSTARSSARSRAGWPQVAVLRRLLRPRDVRPALRRRPRPAVKERYDPDTG